MSYKQVIIVLKIYIHISVQYLFCKFSDKQALRIWWNKYNLYCFENQFWILKYYYDKIKLYQIFYVLHSHYVNLLQQFPRHLFCCNSETKSYACI
jgi:hypothetical protein